MKLVRVVRPLCWVVCTVLAAVSIGVMGKSLIGGLLMLCGAVWLCPASWRAIESLSGKPGSGVALVILAIPLFLLGVHVTTTARELGKAPEPFRFFSDGDFAEDDKAASRPEVNPGALNFFRNIMEQDYLVALEGGKSALNALSMVSPVERMPSSKLARMYDGDEQAIDQFYKGRKVIVSGEIRGVRVDFANDVIVELSGANELYNVQAQLDSDPAKYSGPVLEGEYVNLYCTVFGKVSDDTASNVYLKGCTDVDFSAEAKAYAENLTEALRGWLYTGGRHIFPTDQAASYFLVAYLAGTLLPAENPCLREGAPLEACVSSLEGLEVAKLFESGKGDLQRWRDWLGLQPVNSRGTVSSR